MQLRAVSFQPEPWGDDQKLVALLGDRGAEGFRALFDAFPEAVGILWPIRDAEGRIVDFDFGYGNLSMLRRFRIPPDTQERYTLLEALPRMRDSRAFDAYVGVCESGEAVVSEVTYDTPFGDGYMLGTFIHRAVRLGDGLMVFLSDVTAERRMEDELRGYADVVAHDLREPLAGIAVLVNLLERRGEEPPPPGVVGQLRASTERARALIEGVLVYARSGELQSEPVALEAVMREVAEDLRPAVEDAGGSLVMGELPEVQGDPGQLRRVLQNLVSNALKFRGAEQLRVEVSAVPDSHEWVVTVRDNGTGVDPGQATRIFGMFSRGDGQADGSGIGLAICRRIVEAHGGRIWVEPAERGGSAFRFTLPRSA